MQQSSPIVNSDNSTLKIVCNRSYSKQNIREKKSAIMTVKRLTNIFKSVIWCIVWSDLPASKTHGLLKYHINQGTTKFIPLSRTWQHKATWRRPVDKRTVRLIKKKHRLWNRFMETRDPVTERK